MEEDEICRVCRSEASKEEPLFHPCKCSGSIRFVHQDCLMDWLSHSNKKYCELCNHYFKFTPVYKKDMPSTIPKRIFIQHIKQMAYTAMRWILRACMVSFIWLGLVPYITVWIWRFYFWSADTILRLFHSLFSRKVKATNISNHNTSTRENGGIIESIIYDCFQGWLIDFVVVVTFIAGFLLREWVLQNIPTELHDEDQEEQHHLDIQEQTLPINDPILQPTVQYMPYIEQDRIQEQEDQESPTTQTRRDHAMRPPLLQEPSDYENLEAMWLMNQRQASPPRRGLFDLDEREDLQDDYDDNDDHESEGENYGNPTNSDRVQELLHSIRREHRFTQEEQRLNNNAIAQPLVNNERVEQPAQFDDNRPREDDQNANIIDDGGDGFEEMDGILEAIGMRGSVTMLLQNSGLMTLLISLCVGVGVWLPYVLGVFFITLQPLNGVIAIVNIAHYLSDWIIDYTWDYGLNFYSQLTPITCYLPEWTPMRIRSIVLAATNILNRLISFVSSSTIASISSNSLSPDVLTDPAGTQSHILPIWHNWLLGLEYVVSELQSFLQMYTQMTFCNSVMDRIGCITTGYLVLVFIGSLYLSRTHGVHARIGRTGRQIIRQLGIILKVAFFVVIEINIFPLGCGFLLDSVTLTLFYKIGRDNGNAIDYLQAIHQRMAFLKQNLPSTIFLHWVIGTGFMFLFTTMVSFCRKIVRPGVIWFIRDPNDPQFHPMKELAERPVLIQMKKIATSAAIYGFIIEFGVGGLIAAIGTLFDGVLPLKWCYTQPLSTVPIDLLFVMIVIPVMVRYFDPAQLLENLMVWWTGRLCHQLRLTSFLLGKRPMEEEGYIYYKTWKAWIQRPELKDDADGVATFIKSGQLVRAPKHDSVRHVPGRRMLVPVDSDTFEPTDELERELGHPAGDEENNTTIIYLPPSFKLRMTLFMLIMWVSWCLFMCCLFAGPITFGRWLFDYFNIRAQPIHDVYAYLFGGIILIFIGVFMKQIKNLIALINSFKLNDLLSWISNLCILLVSFGLIIPILFGIIFQLYVILPFQNWGTQAPVVDAFSIWTNGLVCLTLFEGILSVLPASRLHRSFERIQGNGVSSFRFKLEMKELIIPIVSAELAAIILPYILVIAQIQLLDKDLAKQISTFQTAYPSVLIGLVLYYVSYAFTKFGKRWCQSVREDHYLVGRVLHNMEEV